MCGHVEEWAVTDLEELTVLEEGYTGYAGFDTVGSHVAIKDRADFVNWLDETVAKRQDGVYNALFDDRVELAFVGDTTIFRVYDSWKSNPQPEFHFSPEALTTWLVEVRDTFAKAPVPEEDDDCCACGC